MKEERQSIGVNSFLKEKRSARSPLHKSPYREGKESYKYAKKTNFINSNKPLKIQIATLNTRQTTQAREKLEVSNATKKANKESSQKIDKKCNDPNEKILQRISSNLKKLQMRMQQLFFDEMEEEKVTEHKQESKPHEIVSCLVIKKNGSTLSLTKDSSKKRLQGRLTHDGVRSERKNVEIKMEKDKK